MKKKPEKKTEPPAPADITPDPEATPTGDATQPVTKTVTPDAPQSPTREGVPPTLLGPLPEVQRHAVDAAKREENEKAAAGPLDADGVAFDPDTHKATESGEPIKTTKGRWAKKPGRKAGGSPAAPARSRLGGVPNAETANAPQTPEISEAMKTEASAKMAAATFLGVCHGLGGDEWKPEQHEREAMDEAFVNYFKAQEITEFPPSLGLGIVVIGYAAPRFAKPKTQSRFKAFTESLKAKFQSWKADRSRKAAEKTLEDE